ncbi:MAG: hypothetical protein IKI50_03610 [Clostridia bacterium]|nr:hypothetical protein [Clostridia bacterium]
MDEEKIYTLFRYYGDGIMVEKDFLCIKYGTPREILDWLLSAGYLAEIYFLGQRIGTYSDRPYLKAIEKLMYLSKVTVNTISKIDLRMPSCCSCLAISKNVQDMTAFRDQVKALIKQPKIGLLKTGKELGAFLTALDEACNSKDAYADFVKYLPDRYL